MNNEQVQQLIQGIGLLAELYVITYQNFKKQNLSDVEAIKHTKALMSVMVETFTNSGGGSNEQEAT